ncbi:MAG: hypothetical protein CMK83_23125 [Pseudomonadales bacterium]|nr:hypothetical protein [Pseudomonadales bacterium]MAQ27113.1 hypothetical protein [Pseudomonadales bacterium]MBI27881.1 hypothetical protein [Pseudomonadales bacterium]HAG96510.1 hypothetical protein [Gammaproteobacteria bacterium]HAU15488.1 hypothetical protein [Gammaproteobacteria bacterium]|tara:strand:+ start:620 stop:1849 length:1230 start_codon:yes stop_codon:yes gene_type:complete
MSDDNKPLDALTVKRHKEGILVDRGAHRGLRLVVNKGGSKTWVYRYRSKDKQLKQIKLGNYPLMSLTEARVAHLEQKTIREKYGDPQEYKKLEEEKQKAKRAKNAQKTYLVSQLIEDYLNEHIAHRRILKGQIECRRMLEADVTPNIGNMPVLDVRRSHIHDLIQKIAKRAPRIAVMVKVELNGAFEHAISAGRVDMDFMNPTYGVKTPKMTARKRVFTDAELTKFLKWLPHSKMSPAAKNILNLMLLTGCRGGEVVSMEWKNIDLDRGEWHLPKTKNGLSHTVFLSTQAVEILSTIEKSDTGFLFPSKVSKTKPIRQHAIVWQVSKYGGDSGLDHWTSHDLRRTVGTGLAKLGCSRVVQDRILNHVDSSVSGIYDRHSYDSEAKEWWQRWALHLDELIKGKACSNSKP